MISGSPMISPIVMRGFRLAYGSWKIICMRRRILRRSSPFSLTRSSPSKKTCPMWGGRAGEWCVRWWIYRSPIHLPGPGSHREYRRRHHPPRAQRQPVFGSHALHDREVLNQIINFKQNIVGCHLTFSPRFRIYPASHCMIGGRPPSRGDFLSSSAQRQTCSAAQMGRNSVFPTAREANHQSKPAGADSIRPYAAGCPKDQWYRGAGVA